MFEAPSQDKSDLLATRHEVKPWKVIPVDDQAEGHTGLQLTYLIEKGEFQPDIYLYNNGLRLG